MSIEGVIQNHPWHTQENPMNPYRIAASSVATSIALVTLAMAQTTPQPNNTSPSAASSPSQRDATSSQTPEATPSNGSSPAAASSPHQAQALNGQSTKQSLKACMAREQANNSGMSSADAKKSCKDQLKAAAPKNE
jgi:hypothetical protein